MGKKQVILPRKDKDGNYYISYSQYNSFNDIKGFNTSLPGVWEYIQQKFFDINFPDQGWGMFGHDVENYICYKNANKKTIDKLDKENKNKGERLIDDSLNSFTEKEKEILNTVKPLGNFQQEIKIWLLDNVYLLGYIDDSLEDLLHLRDYKTGSKNSVQKYYKDEYKQLDIYAMYTLQETKKLPHTLEVCMIERKGNCYGMKNRRDLLSVGENVWYHKRETSVGRINKIKKEIIETVYQISDLYSVYLKTKDLKQL